MPTTAAPSSAATSRVRVIHLPGAVQREAEFTRTNAHLHYDFVPGIDGARLDRATLQDPRLFAPALPFPGPAAYGCALAHRAQWEHAITQDTPITVAEDDAIFRHDFHAASGAVLAELPPTWDIVLWGWNFDAVVSLRVLSPVSPVAMVFSQPSLRRHADAFQPMTTQAHALPLEMCFGLPAYSISPKGAWRLLASCFPMKDFALPVPLLGASLQNVGIDVAMARAYRDLEAFAAFPPLAITRNVRPGGPMQGGETPATPMALAPGWK